MALPPAAPERQLKPRRSIDVQLLARRNDLWEVGADQRPFQIDRRHALRADAAAVRTCTYYPRWYRRAPEQNPV